MTPEEFNKKTASDTLKFTCRNFDLVHDVIPVKIYPGEGRAAELSIRAGSTFTYLHGKLDNSCASFDAFFEDFKQPLARLSKMLGIAVGIRSKGQLLDVQAAHLLQRAPCYT